MRRPLAPAILTVGLALLVAACGQAARPAATPVARATATATPAPIATPTRPPATPLAWQARTLPVPVPGYNSAPNAPSPGLALTQADANTVYECAPDASANVVHIWLTRDGGAHWSQAADIPTSTPAGRCALTVDDLDPAIAVVAVYGPRPADCTPCYPGPDFNMVTRDAGKTWAREVGPDDTAFDTVFSLATRQGTTFALFRHHPADLEPLQSVLVMSTDHLRTWRPVAAPTIPPSPPGLPDGAIERFWLNPFSGALLLLTTNEMIYSDLFWTSPGPNQPWTGLHAPPFGFEDYSIVVQQPYTEAPWNICGADPANWYDGKQHNPHTHDIACTSDSGATWHTIHLDEATVADDQPEYTLLAVADDGAVLLRSGTAIARLAPPSGQMEPLGAFPLAGDLLYSAGSGAGALWSAPFLGDPNTHDRIYTAAYA